MFRNKFKNKGTPKYLVDLIGGTAKKQYGFSALELLGMLIIFVFLVIFGIKLTQHINKNNKDAQAGNQIKHFNKIAINYLSDQYSDIARQLSSDGNANIIIPFSSFKDYLSKGDKPITTYWQVPCLYVTSQNQRLRAYLFLASPVEPSKNISYLNATQIIQSMSDIAGVLVKGDKGYSVRGGILNGMGYIFSATEIDSLNKQCNFNADKNNIAKIVANSIVVNLNLNKNLFNQIATSKSEQDGSLGRITDKKLTATNVTPTVQTNLYLDNIVLESTLHSRYYCDIPKTPIEDAVMLCKSYAGHSRDWPGQEINYLGDAKWSNYYFDSVHNTCIYSATGLFAPTVYKCDKSTFPSADGYCRNIIYPLGRYYGESDWQMGVVRGEICYWNQAIGKFDTKVCDNAESRSDYWGNFCRESSARGCNCTHVGFPRFYYNASIDRCRAIEYFSCRGSEFSVSGSASPNPYNPDGISWGNCGIKTFDFNATRGYGQSQVYDCGSTYKHAYEEILGAPPQHTYRAIDFGYGINTVNGVTDQRRIQLKSAATPGNPVKTSQLNVSNAGFKAGYVIPISTPMNAGQPCTVNELGRVVEQQVNNTYGIGGQLQCTYSPAYCQSKYCYLPLKPASITYRFNNLKGRATCPAGLLVSSNQPGDAIAQIDCPQIGSDWVRISARPFITGIDCYNNDLGFWSCPTGQSVCNYRNSRNETTNLEVSAMRKLACSVVGNSFLVENYRPN